jgi:aspartate racemase
MHAVHLVAQHLITKKQKRALLLATKFTLNDGFFSDILESYGITVTLPHQKERDHMQVIHDELMRNVITQNANLIQKYNHADVVILGCTEHPQIVDSRNSSLPIIDPVYLQANAVSYALS